MYHQPAITPNYDYAPYPPPPPPSSYDNSQITQPPPRSLRSAAPPQAPSSHQPYNPPPPYPHPAYPYMTHAQQPSQWSSDAWAAHYQQSYAPHPPPPPPPPAEEAPYNSVPTRPDPISSSSTDPRGYSAPPPPEPRRVEERLPPPPNPPQASPRRRERESPPVAPSGTPTGLDFMKLLESYRLIIDINDSPSGPGRPPTVETFERMLQSATYGAQMLESATLQQQQQPPPAEVPRSPKRKEPEEIKEPANGTPGPPPAKRSKTEETGNQDAQKCEGCGATSTPEWRRGPLGPRTLCNACGLVYAKLLKKRFRDSTKGTNGAGSTSQNLGEESVDGDSDEDDDEYASQGQHSEGVGGHRD